VARDRCIYFSASGERSYIGAPYGSNTVMVFGNETTGLPERILAKHADRVYRIPMRPGIRCLNLATAVGIVLYEAIRDLGLQIDERLPRSHAALIE
jgi:tRNA (cytidine/uridine-2'-O-)-methyltransferase